ncbi:MULTISPECIES: hypothetical protein [Paenibacillus]|uniref:DUF2508 family protein n=1 Tax=Paenibacillus campinasensis TaxID=66347 RepID=A0A268EDP1_9BACL|nr:MULTISPECIES: hypothetical protein [Paenibacillus]MUG68887.1 hypothetical protein [Paenibacillus campinasensis]PAD71200.1 hypothetical protein CHH67_25335 [Paenibacillus campinasensis]PAK47747.1 hypothetical protein CHH75_24090 [Paenibacillus sp. 7541]
MKMWWRQHRKENQEEYMTADEQERLWNVYMDVRRSQVEWERAHLLFQEATGQDQIDYAIYILEAAERKYQMNLKQAKRLNLNGADMHYLKGKREGKVN